MEVEFSTSTKLVEVEFDLHQIPTLLVDHRIITNCSSHQLGHCLKINSRLQHNKYPQSISEPRDPVFPSVPGQDYWSVIQDKISYIPRICRIHEIQGRVDFTSTNFVVGDN